MATFRPTPITTWQLPAASPRHFQQNAAEFGAPAQHIIGPLELHLGHSAGAQGPGDRNTDRQAQSFQCGRALAEFPQQRQVKIAGVGADPLPPPAPAAGRLLLRRAHQAGRCALLGPAHDLGIGGVDGVENLQAGKQCAGARIEGGVHLFGIEQVDATGNAIALAPDRLDREAQTPQSAD